MSLSKSLALCKETLVTHLSLAVTLYNCKTNLALWFLLVLAALRLNCWSILLAQPIIVFFLDLLERLFGLSVFAREDSSAIRYNSMRYYINDPYGKGIDLGFNMYDGDYDKPQHQSQQDKFQHMWNKLGLKEGMRVLDCGCGMGDWLSWLKHEKKCTVMGINLTKAHVDVCRNRGLKCIHSDWQTWYMNKAEFDAYRGQFDAVSFCDTIEHYCKPSEITVIGGRGGNLNGPRGNEEGTRNEKYRESVYGTMFKMASDLIDPESKCQGVWTSTLHQARTWKTSSWYGYWQTYVMCSYYDGVYPFLEDGLSKFSPIGNFKLEWQEDRTEDYRQTSLLIRNHFGWFRYGATSAAFLTSSISLLIDPHFFVVHADMIKGWFDMETAWMWHIGGLNPTHNGGDPDALAKLLWQVYRSKDLKQI